MSKMTYTCECGAEFRSQAPLPDPVCPHCGDLMTGEPDLFTAEGKRKHEHVWDETEKAQARSERVKSWTLIFVLLFAIYLGLALARYRFAHQDMTDTQLFLHTLDALLWRK